MGPAKSCSALSPATVAGLENSPVTADFNPEQKTTKKKGKISVWKLKKTRQNEEGRVGREFFVVIFLLLGFGSVPASWYDSQKASTERFVPV